MAVKWYFAFSKSFTIIGVSSSDCLVPRTVCDNPSRSPVLINFFETILFWSVDHLVVSAGAFHISLWPHKIQPREWEKKNKRTIWAWVSSKSKKGSSVKLHSLCIGRRTLVCISSEISTKLLGTPTHHDWPSLTASFC